MDFFISCDSSLVTWLNLSPLVLTIFPSLYLISFLSSCQVIVTSKLQKNNSHATNITHPLLGDDGSMVLDVVVRVDEAVVVHDLPLDLCLGHGDRLGQLGQHLRLGQLHVLAYKYK